MTSDISKNIKYEKCFKSYIV